jgi:lipoprotein-anchoring transpeptidase ErfK/SrfK
MKACFVAVVSIAGLAAMLGHGYAQGYPPYTAPPGLYGGTPAGDDDEDYAPAPGPYGRPGTPNDMQPPRPPGGIQREALPAPGAVAPPPGYADRGALPPPNGRGLTYGPWEPVRPPADVYGPSDRAFPPPGPTGRPDDYGVNRPVDIAPGYASLPPDYQPERQTKELPPQFRRQIVDYASKEPAGTIIIDTPNTYLYLVLGGGKALRYGIGVGREGFTWAGREKISKMAEWPDWNPPKEMIDRQPYLPRFMAGGESNPLGARALYLGKTLYRIHGTNQPSTIGTFVSSGCIRLTNEDVADLYGRVTVGTRVLVLPGKQQVPDTTASVR